MHSKITLINLKLNNANPLYCQNSSFRSNLWHTKFSPKDTASKVNNKLDMSFSFLLLGNCYEGHCLRNAVLKPGSSIRSRNGLYTFILQQNGKLEILCGNSSIWAALDPDNSVKEFTFQEDGNLVLYRNDGSVAWTAGLAGKTPKGKKLIMQNDGNLVLHDNTDNVSWQTATYDKCPAGDMSNNLSLIAKFF